MALGLFAFLGSFLIFFLAQQMLAGSVRGLLLASALQTGLTLTAAWLLLARIDDDAMRMTEASGAGMMVALILPGLGLALVLNSAIGLWYLRRIWQEKRG